MATATSSIAGQDSDQSESKHILVCAIDFGTTFTGFALSFSTDYKNIQLNTWPGQKGRLNYEKAPTCLLLNADKSFYKFGYDAMDKYKELLDKEKDDDYFYFENFKMKLYETEKMDQNVKIPDSKKNFFPAIDIFTKVLIYLREEIENTFKMRCAGLQEDDILWVLTVPAIWSDSAKAFMRKAAVKAGIQECHLVLCLEPEAASLSCLRENACRITSYDGKTEVKPFPTGQKYIIADLGGGTADLSVHEILEDRNLREIRRSDGGPFGGNMVNDAFFEFLQKIFGSNVMAYLRKHNYSEIMDLACEFERKKQVFRPDTNDSYTIKLPLHDIKDAIRDVDDGESFEEKIAKASEMFCNNFSIMKKGAIEIKKPIFEEFFARVVDGIVGFINEMRKEDELNEINIIFMVGGLSESRYVQETIKKRIRGLKVFVPDQPSLAVLKGAVLMGHKPRTITSKVSRFTYGLNVARPFQEGKDPERLKAIREGKEVCTKAFLKLVQKGQTYVPGEEFSGEILAHFGFGLCSDFTSVISTLVTNIYRSEEIDPKYADAEFGCEVGGEIQMPPPLPLGWPPITLFRPKIVLGQSEVSVKVFKISDHDSSEIEQIEATLEFM